MAGDIKHMSYKSFIDCCLNFNISSDDLKEFMFWEFMYDEANKKFDKVVNNEVFGKKDYCDVQSMLDLHLLLLFLQMIQAERDFDSTQTTTGNDYGNLFYIDKYCIKEIRDRYYCKGYDIQAILNVFDLFNLVIENDPPAGIHDGIGFMQISGTTPPINRVS